MRLTYELIKILQTKILDYMKVVPLEDRAWTNQFLSVHNTVSQLELKAPYKLSQACKSLSLHLSASPIRKKPTESFYTPFPKIQVKSNRVVSNSYCLPRRQKDDNYYQKLNESLLREELPQNAPTRRKASALDDKDFWLIDNNIHLASLYK